MCAFLHFIIYCTLFLVYSRWSYFDKNKMTDIFNGRYYTSISEIIPCTIVILCIGNHAKHDDIWNYSIVIDRKLAYDYKGKQVKQVKRVTPHSYLHITAKYTHWKKHISNEIRCFQLIKNEFTSPGTFYNLIIFNLIPFYCTLKIFIMDDNFANTWILLKFCLRVTEHKIQTWSYPKKIYCKSFHVKRYLPSKKN